MIIARTPHKNIISPFTGNRVVPVASHQPVIPSATVDFVVSRFAEHSRSPRSRSACRLNGIVTDAAMNDISPTATLYRIIAAPSAD
jgi:hypothetical protein